MREATKSFELEATDSRRNLRVTFPTGVKNESVQTEIIRNFMICTSQQILLE
jgi:hypothetical protein